MKYLSIAYWNPEEAKLYNNGNLSHDVHIDFEHAHAVCNLLRVNGFGGNKRFFPVKTEVKAMADKDYDIWKETH